MAPRSTSKSLPKIDVENDINGSGLYLGPTVDEYINWCFVDPVTSLICTSETDLYVSLPENSVDLAIPREINRSPAPLTGRGDDR